MLGFSLWISCAPQLSLNTFLPVCSQLDFSAWFRLIEMNILEFLPLTLVALFCVMLVWYLCLGWDPWPFGRSWEVKHHHVSSAKRLLDEDSCAVPVDVRSSGAYHRRRLPGAINAPFDLLENQLDGSALSELDRETPILVYCDAGFRSRRALTAITELKFSSVHHLKQGIFMWSLLGNQTDSGKPVAEESTKSDPPAQA